MATIVEFVLLMQTLDRRLHGLDTRELVLSVTRTVVATVLMAEAIALWLALLKLAGLLELDRKPQAGFAMLGGMAVGAVTYFYASRLLHSEEAETLVQRLPLPRRLREALGA